MAVDEKPVDVWVCLDFEATCDEGNPPLVRRDEAELIEFSFAIYDGAADAVTHSSQHYCRNLRTPLTEFCTTLTGITAEKLKDAGSLSDAFAGLESVLQSEPLAGRSCCAVAHGSWDLELLLPGNCTAAGLTIPPVLRKYVDLRTTAQVHFPGARVSTLAEICRAFGIAMKGREHSGLDDSMMVAQAFRALLKAGAALTIIDPGRDESIFQSGVESRLCMEGLPWAATAPDIRQWLQALGQNFRTQGLQMVLSEGGRPSGRAIVDFNTHEDASAALRLFSGGKVIQLFASSRLVLLRPIRDTERLIPADGSSAGGQSLVSFPEDAASVARLRSSNGPCPAEAAVLSSRPGDWICPRCHDHVFARNSSCRSCGSAKPAGDAVPNGVAAAFRARPGDWVCPSCQDLVFARNSACRTCCTPKPEISDSTGGKAALRPGDWICPTCSDHVFARNAACRRCRTPKPAPG